MRSDLSGANLIDANLFCADLHYANLTGVNMHGADLTSADLSRANLSSSDITGSNLSSADLNYTDFTSANMTNVIMFRSTYLKQYFQIQFSQEQTLADGKVFFQGRNDNPNIEYQAK